MIPSKRLLLVLQVAFWSWCAAFLITLIAMFLDGVTSPHLPFMTVCIVMITIVGTVWVRASDARESWDTSSETYPALPLEDRIDLAADAGLEAVVGSAVSSFPEFEPSLWESAFEDINENSTPEVQYMRGAVSHAIRTWVAEFQNRKEYS